MSEAVNLGDILAAATKRIAAMTPIERAIHDLEQRRSGVRGLQRMDADLTAIDRRIATWPEFVLLQAYRDGEIERAQLKRQRQDLLEANNAYLQRARDAEAALAESVRTGGELAQRLREALQQLTGVA